MKTYSIVKGSGSLPPLEKGGEWRYYSPGAIMQLRPAEAKELVDDGRAIELEDIEDPAIDAEHLLGVPGDEDRLAALEGKDVNPSGIAVASTEDPARAFPAPVAPVAAKTDEGDGGEKLTPKQALVKEAEELGLDTSGTAPELQARIDAKRAEDDANQGS